MLLSMSLMLITQQNSLTNIDLYLIYTVNTIVAYYFTFINYIPEPDLYL